MHGVVGVKILAPNEHGLATPAEADELDAIEDELKRALGASAVFLCRETRRRRRILHWFATEDGPAHGTIETWASGHPNREISGPGDATRPGRRSVVSDDDGRLRAVLSRRATWLRACRVVQSSASIASFRYGRCRSPGHRRGRNRGSHRGRGPARPRWRDPDDHDLASKLPTSLWFPPQPFTAPRLCAGSSLDA